MGGVALRYPMLDPESRRPIDLQGRINQCRRERQGAPPFGFESQELLALTAFVAYQSRGLVIERTEDRRLDPFITRGQEHYRQRIGQLGLSCADCHDDRWGERL